MTPPPISPEALPPGRDRILIAAAAWVLVGIFWALAQFSISEAAFQIADRFGVESLHEVSDAVAWPAGKIYDAVEMRIERRALEGIRDDPKAGAANRAQAETLLKYLTDNSVDYSENMFSLFDEMGVEACVPPIWEYAIYTGVCLAWGLAVAGGGFAITLLIIQRPAGTPETA